MSLKIKVLWTDSDHYHQVSSTAGRGGNPDFALRNCSSLSWVQVLNWPGLGGGEEAVTPWESQQDPAGSQLLLKDCTPWNRICAGAAHGELQPGGRGIHGKVSPMEGSHSGAEKSVMSCAQPAAHHSQLETIHGARSHRTLGIPSLLGIKE